LTVIAAPFGAGVSEGTGVAVCRTNGDAVAVLPVGELVGDDDPVGLAVGLAELVGGVTPPDFPPEHPANCAEIRPTNANSARFRGAIVALAFAVKGSTFLSRCPT
jgi:hypothetical protein